MPSDTHLDTSYLMVSIAKGAGIAFLGMITGASLQYAYHIIIGRYLGAENLGLFAIGLMVTGIATVAARIGLETGIIKFVSDFKSSGKFNTVKRVILTTLYTVSISGVVTGILIFIFSDMLSYIFGKPQLSSLIKILSISIPILSLLTLVISIYQSLYFAASAMLLQNVLWPSLNILFFFLFIKFVNEIEITKLSVSYLTGGSISLMAAIYLLRGILKEEKYRLNDKKDGFKMKGIFRYSIPVVISTLLDQIVFWADIIILGLYRTTSEVGVYNAAARTSMLLTTIIVSFNFLFAPAISEAHRQNEYKKLEMMFKDVARWTTTLSIPVFILITYFSDIIVKIFGSGFAAASLPLIVLAVGQFINNATGSVGTLLLMTGRSNLAMANSVIAAVVNIGLNYILIPKYGMTGAAIGTVISIASINIIRVIEVYFLMGIHPFGFSYLKPFIASAVGICSIWLISLSGYGTGWGGFVFITICFLLVYFLTLLRIGIEKVDYAVIEKFKIVRQKVYG